MDDKELKEKMVEYKNYINIKAIQFYNSSNRVGAVEDYRAVGLYALVDALKKYMPDEAMPEEFFVKKCIKNAMIDEQRRQKSYAERKCNYDDDEVELFSMDKAFGSFETFETRLLIEDIKENLKKKLSYRDYIVFEKHLEGYTQAEIAEDVNLSQKSISNIIKNAIRIARSYL